MANMLRSFLFYVLIAKYDIHAFIPFPLVADGGQTSDSITHTDITQAGFIRSLARFFYETRIRPNKNNGNTVNEQVYFNTQYTIDELYQIAFPNYNQAQIKIYSLPLKNTLDFIMTNNALVDFDTSTKKLSAAHFDSEAFINGSRRILRLKQTIETDALNPNKDLSNARKYLGQLFHTLQDFYSHSNWIEMGKTVPNDLIGLKEIIGMIAGQNQATCTNSGCTRIEKKCSLLQQLTSKNCPLVYYDCKNNILSDINQQQVLTSGYLLDQFTENYEPLSKPKKVQKCSHGSVYDDSTSIPAIGGINKDSNSLLYSPHSNLHFQAADLAIKATELFLNNLRRDIGDTNFARLFIIYPTQTQTKVASDAALKGQRFRFFTPSLSTSSKQTDSFFQELRDIISKRSNVINSILRNFLPSSKDSTPPTYDLSNLGVNVKDTTNCRAAPYVIENVLNGRKKR